MLRPEISKTKMGGFFHFGTNSLSLPNGEKKLAVPIVH
jgi:hypothetical protein